MELNDPFRLNDWKIRDFLTIVLVMQLAVLSVIGSTLFGLDIPVARQVIGFVYLTFIPGIIFLRIFRVHNLSRGETLLYSVGLSIAFLMLLGLSINALYHLFAVSKPISLISLMSTMSATVFVLCTFCYIRDKDFSSTSVLDIKDILSPTTLALCLLPFLSVFGTYCMNFLDRNDILLILLFMISLMPILAMLDRFPKKLYPLAIFAIAISLLYHNTLISTHITGWDIQTEYYFSNLVRSNSYWVSSLPSDINAMLSIVMLAPIFSIVCNLSLVWVFKIIYPLLFSLVPLGLYRVFRSQTDEKIAFLSCFFFMSIFTFYIEMPSLARQQIAEMFQVLLMLLIVDRSMNVIKKSAFGVIFAFSLVTSHYGLSYIFMFSLIIVWIVLVLRKKQQSSKGIVNSHTFVFLYIAFAFTWYIYVSGSSAFNSVIRIGGNIVNNIFDFLNPRTVEGLDIIVTTQTRSPLYEITKILYLIVNFLISAGILAFFLRRTETRFEKENGIFSTVNFAMLLGGITVPYLASALNTSRLYQITLLFLAPFCVIGGEKVWSILGKMFKTSWKSKIGFLKVLSIFFAIFFLFSSGFVYEIAKDHPSSISLGSIIDYPSFDEREIITAEWMKDRANSSIPIYSDACKGMLMRGIFGESHPLFEEIPLIPRIKYFFLGYENVRNGKIVLVTPDMKLSTVYLQNLTLYDILLKSNKIYDNNGANIYIIPNN